METPTAQFWQLVVGLIVTVLLGLCVGPLLSRVSRSIESLPDPLSQSPSISEKWRQLTRGQDLPGGRLGFLERLLFFFAIWSGHWEIVAGWLAFKLASKWEIYKNIIVFPPKLDGIDDFDYLLSRRRLGSERLMRFLIGTAANVLAAVVGVGLGSHGYETVRPLFC